LLINLSIFSRKFSSFSLGKMGILEKMELPLNLKQSLRRTSSSKKNRDGTISFHCTEDKCMLDALYIKHLSSLN
jgi:hypothetical protein